ncbi:MAG: hypothetical protein ACYC1U_10855, partial [Candidatus Aquicultorales bacterium]
SRDYKPNIYHNELALSRFPVPILARCGLIRARVGYGGGERRYAELLFQRSFLDPFYFGRIDSKAQEGLRFELLIPLTTNKYDLVGIRVVSERCLDRAGNSGCITLEFYGTYLNLVVKACALPVFLAGVDIGLLGNKLLVIRRQEVIKFLEFPRISKLDPFFFKSPRALFRRFRF